MKRLAKLGRVVVKHADRKLIAVLVADVKVIRGATVSLSVFEASLKGLLKLRRLMRREIDQHRRHALTAASNTRAHALQVIYAASGTARARASAQDSLASIVRKAKRPSVRR